MKETEPKQSQLSKNCRKNQILTNSKPVSPLISFLRANNYKVRI